MLSVAEDSPCNTGTYRLRATAGHIRPSHASTCRIRLCRSTTLRADNLVDVLQLKLVAILALDMHVLQVEDLHVLRDDALA